MALDAFKMRIVAQALMVLRQKLVAIRLVNQDFQMAAASKNEVISIPDSVAQAVHDVVPSQTFPVKVEVDPDDRLLRLDQWKETYFDAVDKDEVEANTGWFMRQTEQCAKALANGMDGFVHLLFARFCSLGVGVAGTTPFAASGDELGEFFSGNESLNKGLADESNRYLIVDPAANTNLMKQSAFAAADERGSTITGLTGQLGRKFGYDCFMSSERAEDRPPHERWHGQRRGGEGRNATPRRCPGRDWDQRRRTPADRFGLLPCRHGSQGCCGGDDHA